MIQHVAAGDLFVTEWGVANVLPAPSCCGSDHNRDSISDRIRFPLRSRNDHFSVDLIPVEAPDLFARGVRRTQAQERELALEAAAKHVQERGGFFDRANARVLDLRVITPSESSIDEVKGEWLYVVVTPRSCVVVTPGPCAVLDRAFPPCGVGMIDNSSISMALRIIATVNDGTAETLDTLERAATQTLDHGGLSTAEQVDRIPKFSRAMRYVARRLAEEKAAIKLLSDVDLRTFGITDRDLISSALTTQDERIKDHSEIASLALGALTESLGIAQWKVEDANRRTNEDLQKAQLAEVEAQKSSNSYTKMLTILGGVTVPIALALGYVQAFQLTDVPAYCALGVGGFVSGVLLTFFKPMYRWLKGNGKGKVLIVPSGGTGANNMPGPGDEQGKFGVDADANQLVA